MEQIEGRKGKVREFIQTIKEKLEETTSKRKTKQHWKWRTRKNRK
jgi:hypothetical protein